EPGRTGGLRDVARVECLEEPARERAVHGDVLARLGAGPYADLVARRRIDQGDSLLRQRRHHALAQSHLLERAAAAAYADVGHRPGHALADLRRHAVAEPADEARHR